VEVVASLSQGRTAAAQCGLFTCKTVPVIFEPPLYVGIICLCKCDELSHTNVITKSLKHINVFCVIRR